MNSRVDCDPCRGSVAIPGIVETLLRENDRLVSIVGGGGKTSLMFLLAHALRKKGFRVVSSTTTRILTPTMEQSPGLVLLNHPGFKQTLQDSLDRYGHVTVAQDLLAEGDKLQGLSCSQVESILDYSCVERMIIEADGARNLSFKAPGDNEPVVPQRTDLFVSVVGLDIIGKILDDANVFRAGLVSSLTGLPMGDAITSLTVAQLVVHANGLLKGCPGKACSALFLNKTDIPGGREKALSVIEAVKKLEGKKPDFWLSGSIGDNLCEATDVFQCG